MNTKKQVVIGLLGSVLDSGFHQERWNKWRPSVSLCKHAALPIDRFELIYDPKFKDTANVVMADIPHVAANTEVRGTEQALRDPWDFEEVYASLHDFARSYEFKPDTEDYLVHITTGSHVQQICLFLLTESRHFPARLVQTSPADTKRRGPDGKFAIIDLDAATCELAATIAEQTGVRTLDALHLGAARRIGGALTFATFDVRQAQAARLLGTTKRIIQYKVEKYGIDPRRFRAKQSA